jgi:hypothetical protein
LTNDTILVRTVGRVIALNKQIYDDIPHVPSPPAKKPPGLHPYKPTHAPEYWFIDGRMMDVALDSGKWWSIIILDGHSRTISAGAMAPSEASWAVLMGLSTAVLYCPRATMHQTRPPFPAEQLWLFELVQMV